LRYRERSIRDRAERKSSPVNDELFSSGVLTMPVIISLTNPSTSIARLVLPVVFIILAAVCGIAQDDRSEAGDLVHYGDLIDLDVAGGFEFDWRGRLNPEGFLDGLNTYGEPVYGLCRSEKEIAADVVKVYRRLLRDPVVTIKIIDRSNRAAATLDGAIRSPQRFQMRRPARLLELIVMSGGITDDAGGDIQIVRPSNLSCEPRESKWQTGAFKTASGVSGNGTLVEVITISDLLSGKQEANQVIRSGDVVLVKRSTPIYVIGGVNIPRNIAARSGMTLTRAIASAGGISKEADAQNVVLYRKEGSDARILEFDLTKITGGSVADPELRAYDIVEVGQKGRGKRRYPPVVTGVQFAPPNGLPLRIVD